jgi:hypothetical protein
MDMRPMSRVRRVCRRSLEDRRVDMLEELMAGKLGVVCYVISEGLPFQAPWVLRLRTRASPSKANKVSTTKQLIEDGVIGLSEKERRGLRGILIGPSICGG